AKNYYEQAVDISRKHFDENHPNVQTPLAGLGMMLLKSGRAAEAEPVLREVLKAREDADTPDPWLIALAQSTLGECLTSQKRFDEAAPLVVDSYGVIESSAGEKSHLVAYRVDALQRIIDLYDAWEQPARADEWRAKLDALKEAIQAKKS
ncbi:MAG: tetratricopeptide repeat protein, partial [Phycisphaerales bacterium]|nr:tetratricopeptide repeat protein [Phycisphaerales bacterium]